MLLPLAAASARGGGVPAPPPRAHARETIGVRLLGPGWASGSLPLSRMSVLVRPGHADAVRDLFQPPWSRGCRLGCQRGGDEIVTEMKRANRAPGSGRCGWCPLRGPGRPGGQARGGGGGGPPPLSEKECIDEISAEMRVPARPASASSRRGRADVISVSPPAVREGRGGPRPSAASSQLRARSRAPRPRRRTARASLPAAPVPKPLWTAGPR